LIPSLYTRDDGQDTAFTAVLGGGCDNRGHGFGNLLHRLAPDQWQGMVHDLGCDAMLSAAISGGDGTKVSGGRNELALFAGSQTDAGFCASAIAGALMTLVLLRAGAFNTIPGTWLLLYGAGVVTGGLFPQRFFRNGNLFYDCRLYRPLRTPSAINWLWLPHFGGITSDFRRHHH